MKKNSVCQRNTILWRKKAADTKKRGLLRIQINGKDDEITLFPGSGRINFLCSQN